MPPDPASGPALYTSTFIFAKGQYDEEFHRLDAAIAEAAKSIPGYLGEESWENAATGLISNVYYWSSLEALRALMEHPRHLEAKARQGRWLEGYQVVVAQVLHAYGDGKLAHPAAGSPGR
jgi:heme-degrading monooxygenase HmoA